MVSVLFLSPFILWIAAVPLPVYGYSDFDHWRKLNAVTDAEFMYPAAADPYTVYRQSGKTIVPEVHRHRNIIPREVCQKIIDMAEATGFPLAYDTIDENVRGKNNSLSQAIDIRKRNGKVLHPELLAVIEPYIPALAGLVKKHRDEDLDRMIFPDEPADREPTLGFVFARKYAPDSPRNSLIPHHDHNMFTVNIALNEDYTGGGVFVLKPSLDINPDWIPEEDDPEPYMFRGPDQRDIPFLHDYQYEYAWTDSLKRENSTSVMFPSLETGDVLIHNYTVWHAVAPLETGVRYMLAVFFDSYNPMLDRKNDYPTEVSYAFDHHRRLIPPVRRKGKTRREVRIRHRIKECDPRTGRLVYIQDGLDVFWVDTRGKRLYNMATNLRPSKTFTAVSVTGHAFWVLRHRMGLAESNITEIDEEDVLASVTIEPKKANYEFVGSVQSQEDCETAVLGDEF